MQNDLKATKDAAAWMRTIAAVMLLGAELAMFVAVACAPAAKFHNDYGVAGEIAGWCMIVVFGIAPALCAIILLEKKRA